MPKNVQTTAQLHSPHTLESHAQNFPRQASTVHEHEIPDVQAEFSKARGARGLTANIS